MSHFYIEEITLLGPGKKNATVTFKKGLNIISGPSNTGKTSIVQAIDFMYGGSTPPFSEQTGYNTVLMKIKSSLGYYTLSRGFDDKQITVTEFNAEGYCINDYSLSIKSSKTSKDTISNFWLKQIGIMDDYQILKNSNFKTQTLTWRTFSHSLLISERLIGTTKPILLPEAPTARTAYLSSLIFLLTGKDSSDYPEQESADHIKVRKASVSKYINDSLSELYEKYDQVKNNLGSFENIDIEHTIETSINDLAAIEEKITKAIDDNRIISQNILKCQQELKENELLANRYKELRSQYQSDLERLTLIVDGEHLFQDYKNHQNETSCPFCDGILPEQKLDNYIEASKSEFNNINSQLSDLTEANQDIIDEIKEIKNTLASFELQKKNINELINTELRPEADKLKNNIRDYRIYINLKNEVNSMEAMQTKFNNDLKKLNEAKNSPAKTYHPKENFDAIFWKSMSDNLEHLLKECNYSPLKSSYFARDTFDLIINGENKDVSHGKGYRSFLNTLVVLAYRKVLADYAEYNPGVFVIDTPLLGLDEGENAPNLDSMQKSLFQYFIDHQDEGQLIIVENTNELPALNYEDHDVHQIIFTHDKNNGRFGFLYDI